MRPAGNLPSRQALCASGTSRAEGGLWKPVAVGGKGFMSEKERERPARNGARDSEEIRARQSGIGRRLRQMYDDVVNEPVPDDFSDLLDQIEQSKSKK